MVEYALKFESESFQSFLTAVMLYPNLTMSPKCPALVWRATCPNVIQHLLLSRTALVTAGKQLVLSAEVVSAHEFKYLYIVLIHYI